ncbi:MULTISPECIES: VanZ family protein [Bacillus]|uniref:VanZ family protein n=1 Tax=Bacillus TaxID=1386 RepID=UPI000BB89643|nr:MULTISPECIES: VanZ family protein [Bacillus]
MYWNIAAIGILFLATYIIIDIIKNKKRNIIKRVVIYSFIVYGINVLNVTLGMLTIQPEPIALNIHWYLQLKPFLFLREWIGMYNNNGMDWFFWNSVKLSFYNFILLFPLGVYLSFFNVKNMKKAAFIIFLVSLTIEALQLLLSYGGFLMLHRTFNVDDLILNTVGGVFGYFSFELFKNIYSKYKSIRSTPL